MKKWLCVLLTLSLFISVFTVGAAAEETEDVFDLKIAVASDLHYEQSKEQLEGDIDDEIYWYANRRAEMQYEGIFIIDSFLAQCAADEKCAYILIPGDLAGSGRTSRQDHYDIAAKLAAFEETTGKQVFVIDGNHDLGDGQDTDMAVFKEIYNEFGYSQALVKDEATCSYTADLGDKYRLIALDSCDPTVSTADGMSQEKLDWVHEQANAAKADGKYPILMMHHNLLDHMPLQRVFSKNFIIRNHLTTADLFANWGIKTVFTGHEHCSDVTSYTSTLGNVIYDFANTALTMYPLQYRVVTFSDDEIVYQSQVIDSIDTDALTAVVSGYTPAQIALMNEDLNAYAKGFLKVGIEYRLAKGLSAEGAGIAADSPFYDLADKALKSINNIMDMPLYGENGLQQLAKQYNIDIPDSEYENVWDVATDLVAAHYRGEESSTLESPEVTILLRAVAIVLRTELSVVSNEEFSQAAESFLVGFGGTMAQDELDSLGKYVYGNITPGEYFLLALLSPVLYQFAFDDDGVNDNNGTLSGYGTASFSENVANIEANFDTISANFILYLTMIMKYINKILAVG